MKKIVLCMMLLTIAHALQGMELPDSTEATINTAITQIFNKQYQEQMRVAKKITPPLIENTSNRIGPEPVSSPKCANKNGPGFYSIGVNGLQLIDDTSVNTIFTFDTKDRVQEDIQQIVCNRSETIAFHTEKNIWTITPKTSTSQSQLENICQVSTQRTIHTIRLNNYGWRYLATIISSPPKSELSVYFLDGATYKDIDISSFDLTSPSFFIDFINIFNMDDYIVICDGKQVTFYSIPLEQLLPSWKPENGACLRVINNNPSEIAIIKDKNAHTANLFPFEVKYIMETLLATRVEQQRKQKICAMAQDQKSSIQEIYEVAQNPDLFKKWQTQRNRWWITKHPWITTLGIASLAAIIYFILNNK